MLVPSRMGKRSNAREELRRRAAYVVNNSDDKTRFTAVMTPEAAAVYFNAITTKKAASFGIAKLSQLNLNITYNLNSVLLQEYWVRAKLLKKGFTKMTLLQYACFTGNDIIVSALLKAGADPCYMHQDDSVRRYLLETFPKPFLVYMLIRLSSFDCSAHTNMNSNGDCCGKLSCVMCNDNDHDDNDGVNENDCKGTSEEDIVYGMEDHVMMTKWPCCQHVCCNKCVWRWFCRKQTLHAFTCPLCGTPLDKDQTGKEVGTNDNAYLDIFIQESPGRDNSDSNSECMMYKPLSSSQLEVISQRRVSSLRKWLQLPQSSDSCTKTSSSSSSSSKTKSSYRNVGKFKAMSMKEWSWSNLGTTRANRVEKLSIAAMKDQPERILALSEVGVCVDGYSMSDVSGTTEDISLSSFSSSSSSSSSSSTSDTGDMCVYIPNNDVKTGTGISVGGTEYGQTALHLAVSYGNVNSVKALIFIGANVNACDNSNTTPIILAASSRQHEIFKVLLAAGADIGRRNLLNLCAFDYANIQRGWLNPDEDYAVVAMKSMSLKNSDDIPFPPPLPSPPLLPSVQKTSTPFGDAFVVDHALSSSFIQQLIQLFINLPEAPICKKSSSTRRYYCDGCSYIRASILHSLPASEIVDVNLYPHMRFLHYETIGGDLPAHNDLSRSLPSSQLTIFNETLIPDPRLGGLQNQGNDSNRTDIVLPSTHTFILYLTDCDRGGETVLLHSMKSSVLQSPMAINELLGPPDNVILSVKPIKGRILLFPHACPHSGASVECVPKLLLRGEARV